MTLVQQIEELASYIEHRDHKNTNITKTTVGWQLDHALQVVISIIKMLETSDPKEYKWRFSASKLYIMARGVIPRGIAKAPREVRSKKEQFEANYLEGLVEEAKKRLENIEQIHPKAFFEHPYFGKMKKKETIKFMGIHTEHHLKIVRDMLK